MAVFPGPLQELAPAKVNLALHVTGRRPDGYHLLDSLVVFARVGDMLEAEPAAGVSLTLGGKFGGSLGVDGDNSVLRAAALLRPQGQGAALRLTKVLPVAAGLGGGSADAAAALRLLARLWGLPLPRAEETLALGADVPVCLAGRAARMRGIGERLDPVDLPPFWLVLANPGVPVSTPAVFAALAARENPGLPPIPALGDAAELCAWLGKTRNDLETPARRSRRRWRRRWRRWRRSRAAGWRGCRGPGRPASGSSRRRPRRSTPWRRCGRRIRAGGRWPPPP